MEFQQYQPDEAIYRLMRLKGELVECHFEIRNEIKTYAINALVICEKKVIVVHMQDIYLNQQFYVKVISTESNQQQVKTSQFQVKYPNLRLKIFQIYIPRWIKAKTAHVKTKVHLQR